MKIYTIDDLRRAAPNKYKNFSDSALICDYSSRLNEDPNVIANTFGLEQLTPIDCDNEIYWQQVKDYKVPISGEVWGLVIALSFSFLLFAAKRLGRNFRAGSYRGLITLSLIYSSAFGLALGVVSAISKTIYTAALISVAWSIALFLFFSAFGCLRIALNNGQINQFAKIFVIRIRLKIIGRKDKAIWTKVATEMNSDFIDSGLWARSLSQANGREDAAKAIYSELRYDEIVLGQIDG
jgi:hypothetical protein